MKGFYCKILVAALLAGGVSTINATDFPEAKLVSPIPGLSTFSTISVTWDYQTFVEGDASNRMVTITTPSGEEYTVRGYTEYVVENDQGGTWDNSTPEGENALSASFYKTLTSNGIEIGSFTDPGIYTINILEGAVSINGVPNPATTLTYKLGSVDVMEPATYEYNEETTPTLLITWDHQTLDRTRAGKAGGFAGVLTETATGTEREVLGGAFSMIEDDTVLKVNLNGFVTKPGEYIFELPGGLLQNAAGEQNATQAFTFTYGEAGIESIILDNKAVEVYDLSGRKVVNPDKGVYIIDGKKILVK